MIVAAFAAAVITGGQFNPEINNFFFGNAFAEASVLKPVTLLVLGSGGFGFAFRRSVSRAISLRFKASTPQGAASMIVVS